jgi:hypothetical protein
MPIVPPYCGQSQTSRINVPATIVYKSYQYSPEEGPWLIPPYAQIFGIPAQPDAQPTWLPPPLAKTDLGRAQQTYPL